MLYARADYHPTKERCLLLKAGIACRGLVLPSDTIFYVSVSSSKSHISYGTLKSCETRVPLVQEP